MAGRIIVSVSLSRDDLSKIDLIRQAKTIAGQDPGPVSAVIREAIAAYLTQILKEGVKHG